MGSFAPSSAIVRPQTVPPEVLLRASGVGVEYVLGNRREDVKSLTHNLFRLRRRQTFWALRDVGLVGCAGEVLGIIGANGVGKTTLCRVLSGLLRPDRGRVETAGRVLALLALGTGFNTRLSGRENIFLNGMVLGFSQQRLTELFSQIVAFSELERFIDQPLKSYSNGMVARLGFSIAASLEPEILILDETLSAGDLAFSEKAGQRMRELTRRAKLVIVVTHGLPFVETYCTRAVWIDGGVVRASGSAREVVWRYRQTLPTPTPARRLVSLPQTTSRLWSRPVVVARHLGVRFALRPARTNVRGWPWFRKKPVFEALRNVSLEVCEGDILGIIGPNGAGKTTLCRVLSGLLRADTGCVNVEGEITALLTFGVGFHEQLNGRDNVYLNGMMLGLQKKRLTALYPQIVEFAGLRDFIHQPIKHYSSGMRSRLGFSVAAMIRPDVFIIDEALGTGDAAFSERASGKLQDLIAGAKAVIVVTHSLEFVTKVCTRAVWLEAGAVRFVGSPAETVDRYRRAAQS